MILYTLCLHCAACSGWTVRQLIGHAARVGGMPWGASVCEHAS